MRADREEQAEPKPTEHVSRAERRAVSIDALATLQNRSVVPVKIVNLSYDGCKIEIAAPVQAGERMQITVKGSIIDAKICWYREGTAGLSFTWDRPRDAPPTAGNIERSVQRIVTSIQATMQRHGQNKYSVSVSDMSPEGCKVEFVDRPSVGERVHMRFQGLHSLEGEVRWIVGNDAGVSFDRPIHPAVFDQIIARSALE